MPLFSRWALPEDLIHHKGLLTSSYGLDEGLHRELPNVWRMLADRSNLISTILEEGAEPTHRTAVHSMAGVFVDDTTAKAFVHASGRRIGECIAREVLAGGAGILDLNSIRERQVGEGLIFAVLHSTFFNPNSTHDELLRAQEAASYGLSHALRGYRLKALYRDANSDQKLSWLQSGGMKMIERTPGDLDRGASVDNPILMRITADDAEHERGTRLSALFVEYPAMFGLKASFRELLEVALHGSTDKQIAQRLGVSVPAVKRRWERLYIHMEASHPELWRSWSGEMVESARGAERRRHLLSYFRDHPEELRPWVD